MTETCSLGECWVAIENSDDSKGDILLGHGVAALEDGEPRALGALVRCGEDAKGHFTIIEKSGGWWGDPCVLVHTPGICREGRYRAAA